MVSDVGQFQWQEAFCSWRVVPARLKRSPVAFLYLVEKQNFLQLLYLSSFLQLAFNTRTAMPHDCVCVISHVLEVSWVGEEA